MPRDAPSDRLSPLQWRILRVLSSLDPAWTLSGGGALVGFYLKHRETKDLDPSEVVESPRVFDIGARIQVDSPHEILVNKLCALLGRAELRDLIDLRDLLAQGGNLERALRDAPRKDGGCSPLTLAWVLKETGPGPAARASGWTESQIRDISDFHSSLIEKLIAAGSPE